jgi:hypothetical protein
VDIHIILIIIARLQVSGHSSPSARLINIEAIHLKETPALLFLRRKDNNMAPFMSGFPLENVHWNRFKGSYMWNNIYHLRRTKFIVYQLATLFTCVCNSIGVALLTGVSL